jgi:hypothetical protein
MKDHVHDEQWNRKIAAKNGRAIIKPSYTHWTISYALTLEGKLDLDTFGIRLDPLIK